MAVSNLPAILTGIAATLSTATGVQNVLTHPPAGPSNDPLIYIIKPRAKRIQPAYGEQAIEWTFEAAAAIPTGNNEQAETDLYAVIVSIFNVAGHDLDAGEAIADGQVLIESGNVDYGKIQGIPVIAFTFQIVIVERVPYEYAL